MTSLDEVAAASAKLQKSFEWMLEFQRGGGAFESLRTTGDDVATLDAKLASALTHVSFAGQEGRCEGDGQAPRRKAGLVHVRSGFQNSNMVCEGEHFFSNKLKGDRHREVVATWDQVLS